MYIQNKGIRIHADAFCSEGGARTLDLRIMNPTL